MKTEPLLSFILGVAVATLVAVSLADWESLPKPEAKPTPPTPGQAAVLWTNDVSAIDFTNPDTLGIYYIDKTGNLWIPTHWELQAYGTNTAPTQSVLQ